MYAMDCGMSNVPAFLVKLWKLVEDPECDKLISWSERANSFIIRNEIIFAKKLLPKYFKHNNMASFIRQLNMYGFKKMPSFENSITQNLDTVEFSHPYFCKGQSALLHLIKRKAPMSKDKSNDAQDILTDLTTIRQRQENMDSLLVNMKKENELLWRELSSLRQKHNAQEQIIQKVIQFLVSIVQGKNIPLKRKNARMLTQQSKKSRLSGQLDLVRGKKPDFFFSVANEKLSSSSGPVIHEVTELENDNSVDSIGVACSSSGSEESQSLSQYFGITRASPDSDSAEPLSMSNQVQKSTSALPAGSSEWSDHVLGLITDFTNNKLRTEQSGNIVSIPQKHGSNIIMLPDVSGGNLLLPESPDAVNLKPDDYVDVKPQIALLQQATNAIFAPEAENSVFELSNTEPSTSNVVSVAGTSQSNASSMPENSLNVISMPQTSLNVISMPETSHNVISIPENCQNVISIPEVTSHNGKVFVLSPMPMDGFDEKDQSIIQKNDKQRDSQILCNTNAIPLPLKESDVDSTSLDTKATQRQTSCIGKDIIFGKRSTKNDAKNLQLALSDSASGSDNVTKNAFSNHILGVEEELDWLQDQLIGGDLNLDPSVLLGLFSGDDVANNAAFANQFATDENPLLKDDEPGVVGNEVVQFTPSLLDLPLDDVDNMSFLEYLNEDDETKKQQLKENVDAIQATHNYTHDNNDTKELVSTIPKLGSIVQLTKSPCANQSTVNTNRAQHRKHKMR